MKDEMQIAEKIDFFKKIAFWWSQALSASEIKLLYWLTANTLGRGNLSGTYSLTQIVSGVPYRDRSDWWCGGVGMSESSVRRAIERLRARGVIETQPGRMGTRFTVNVAWMPTYGAEQIEGQNDLWCQSGTPILNTEGGHIDADGAGYEHPSNDHRSSDQLLE